MMGWGDWRRGRALGWEGDDGPWGHRHHFLGLRGGVGGRGEALVGGAFQERGRGIWWAHVKEGLGQQG